MKPILFNTDMVRAILEGRKTVTRRVVKPQPFAIEQPENAPCWCGHFISEDRKIMIDKPPYRPGDILYVRETWQYAYDLDGYEQPIEGTGRYMYAADDLPNPFVFLRVTDVRVERLQNITELDILEKEGVTVDFPQPKPSYMSLAYTETRLKPAVKKAFAETWDSTIKPADRALYDWEANPWVWVIEFERTSREEVTT